MNDSPAVILYDASGNPMAVAHGDAIGSTKGVLIACASEYGSGDAEYPVVSEGGGLCASAYPHSTPAPDPWSYISTTRPRTLMSEPTGALRVRAQVLSDEGVFRDGFAGSSLEANLTGTITFVNGSPVLNGSGTQFTTELSTDHMVRHTSDGQSSYARIGRVVSDTMVILRAPYSGTTGAAAGVKSYWARDTNGGASISVASSEVRLVSGTSNGDYAEVVHFIDNQPIVATFSAKISARNANQESVVGFAGDEGGKAQVLFVGTDDTKIKLRTQSVTGYTLDTEVDLSYFDSSWTSDDLLSYRLVVRAANVDLYVEGKLVCSHNRYLPAPYESLTFVARTENTAATTSTQLTIDIVTSESVNLVQVDSLAGELKSVLYHGGRELALTNGYVLDSIQPLIAIAGKSDQSDIARPILLDDYGAVKTVNTPPVPPPNATEVAISQDDAYLAITTTDQEWDTEYTIPNGKTFYLQNVIGGAEGDPSERGSKMEIVYVDSSSVEHIVTRFYLVGQTITATFPDSSKARDGTQMDGNGSTTKVVLRRVRLSNAAQQVDGEIRGYVKDTPS